MPIQCPTCSRVNPANASYCFYDGRSLARTGVHGPGTVAPAGLGTRPFPLPFSFSDGQGCANFNQLVLACDQRWSESRANLLNGTWQSFFSAIGRVDLAALALQASREPDHDVGLCRLLEGLPADSEALRPPKLGLPSLVENLSGLEPGKDHKFQLVIQNQGSLLLSGSVTTDCDWLCFGDRQGRAASKLFQTRDSFTVSVWVAGNKLRAAKIPYEGKIHVDTNGGRQAVLVVAKVPLRPFPKGNVLSGATTPRELATKARQHAKEAAVLFEQGMVKAWYEGNGWIYPIQGVQAHGAGALQQFFEALGLTKPPKLSISTQRIDCKGEEGSRITKNVVLSTEEAKIVHAVGHSNQPWVKVLPGKGQGKSLTIPLSIEVPATPGETVHASVTFVGNGQQQFVVPISLTVEGLTPQQAEEQEQRGKRRELLYAGVGLCALLVVGLGVALFFRSRSGGGDNGEVVDNTQIPPVEVAPPPARGKAWWDSVAGTNLPGSFEKLRQAAGAQHAVLDAVTAERDLDRSQAYKQLAEKLTELWRNPAARGPLAQFVTECCVHEPSALALDSLRRAVSDQFPVEDREYPDDKCEDIDRANFWLTVVFDAMAHKAANRDRNRDLTNDLVRVLDFDPDPGIPLNDLKEQAQKALAVLCYHNTLPTAEKSLDHALTVREALLVRFGPQLPANMREQDDVRLLALGLPKGSELWPKLRPIFEACVKSNEIGVVFKIVDLYAKAPGDLVPHMEDALKTRWRAAGNPKLNRAAKVDAMRNSIASAARAAKIKPQQRLAQLQGLVSTRTLSAARPEGPQPNASLLDTVHLAHASTMASLLSNKDAEVGRFDDLVANLPSFDSDKPMPEVKKPDDKPRKTEGLDVIEVVAGIKILKGEPLTNKNEVDPRRGAFRRSFLAHLRAGEVYLINMESTDFTPYLRLETLAGKEQYHAKGANAQITYQPVEEADYRIIASSLDKGGTGTFTIKITHQQKPVYRFGFRGRPFGPPGPFGGPVGPGGEENNQNQGNSGAVDRKAAEVSQGDLTDLASKQSTARMAAFKNLAGSVPNELAYRHAIKLASYLLTEPWVAAELNSATEALPALSRCARLYQALSDVIAKGEKLNFERTVAVVGALLEQPQLRFDQDDPNWRASCRKLLLNRCLELTEPAKPATNPADKAADLLRDLYKEQGLAFGLDSPDFEDESHLTSVLERLIKHVAGKNAEAKINRELQATRFSAGNDLEHVVLLQRLWLQVLIKAIHDQAPDDARQQLLELPRQLDAADSKSTSLLDQLRAGEQTILRAWALTRNLRVK